MTHLANTEPRPDIALADLSSAGEPSSAAWQDIFEPATQSASTAMRGWTHGDISLSLDEIREAPLEEIAEMLQLDQAIATVVLIHLTGDFGGQLVLVFEDDSASQLVASLLSRSARAFDDWSELDRSALRETGNILGSAYLNCITRLTGHRLLPSPPYLMREYASSVLEQAVMNQALVDDRVLLCRACFKRSGNAVDWKMFFVPSPELLGSIRKAIDGSVQSASCGTYEAGSEAANRIESLS